MVAFYLKLKPILRIITYLTYICWEIDNFVKILKKLSCYHDNCSRYFMFGKYNGFVSKSRVSACMYFLVVYNNSIYIGVWEGEGRGIGYPQIVGQSRPFGQYSLHSRAILLLKLIGEILSILGEKYKVIINYNTFRFLFVVTPPPPPPPSQLARKHFLTSWAQ